MKKLIFFSAISLAFIFINCKPAIKDFVLTGQLYGTSPSWRPEKITGKVKDLKVSHFWAKEENGKIVKGGPLTSTDRQTIELGSDYTETFNPSGALLQYSTLGDEGKVIFSWVTEAEGKIISKASYIRKDTTWYYIKPIYEGDNIIEIKGYNQKNDTLMMTVKYELDEAGNRTKVQFFNFRNEPGNYMIYHFDEKGLLRDHSGFSNDGKIIQELTYTYDDRGERLNQHQKRHNTGEIVDYDFKNYEYDKNGNWTSYVFYKDGKPFVIRQREITYY